jgi:hypothetical protein
VRTDEPGRLRPIRFDPKHRWYFVVDDINDRYARAMFHMDIALWAAEDDASYPHEKGTN